jgi:hypothetical protein
MIWNVYSSLTIWEISTFVAWTLFCAGCLRAALRAQKPKSTLSYSAIWLGGFLATFMLLQAVRGSPASIESPSIAKSTHKSVPKDDESKLSNIASARY